MGFLRTGQMYSRAGQYSKKPKMEDIIKGSLWEAAENALSKMDPRIRMHNNLEKKVKEVHTLLQQAADNASRLGSQDALDYVQERADELNKIISSMPKMNSIDIFIAAINIVITFKTTV